MQRPARTRLQIIKCLMLRYRIKVQKNACADLGQVYTVLLVRDLYDRCSYLTYRINKDTYCIGVI